MDNSRHELDIMWWVHSMHYGKYDSDLYPEECKRFMEKAKETPEMWERINKAYAEYQELKSLSRDWFTAYIGL